MVNCIVRLLPMLLSTAAASNFEMSHKCKIEQEEEKINESQSLLEALESSAQVLVNGKGEHVYCSRDRLSGLNGQIIGKGMWGN